MSTSAVSTIAALDGGPGYWITLNSVEVDYVRTVKVVWDFLVGGNAFTNVQVIEIVQPLVSLDQFKQQYPQYDVGGADEKTTEELKAAERKVRKVIETFTGQSFAPMGYKTLRLIGSGSNFLNLPYRIYDLDYVSAVDPNVILYDQNVSSGGVIYGRDSDGNVINPPEVLPNTPPVDLVTWDDESRYYIRRKLHRTSGWDVKADITPGYINTRTLFESGRTYLVRAAVGWEYVPNEISLAAMILMDDYLCPEAVYHERGARALRSADWRIDYAHDPYYTTGNVVVDQLLSKYTQDNWMIL